jgi:hypothetical protein
LGISGSNRKNPEVIIRIPCKQISMEEKPWMEFRKNDDGMKKMN